jgi:Domain of unknown function (DUF4157)
LFNFSLQKLGGVMKSSGLVQKKSDSLAAPIPLSTGMFGGRSVQRQAELEQDAGQRQVGMPDYASLMGNDPRGGAVQPKLTVGAPNDQYEQEADRVADQVMSTPDSAVQQPVQREAMPEAEEAVQTKPIAATITPLVQREAMPKGEEVQAKPIGTLQREEAMHEEEELQMKPIGDSIQREEMPEETEALQMKPIATLQREEIPEEEVQTKPALQKSPDGNLQAGGSIESQLNSSKGGGSPLSEDVRSFMEPRFGADFSGVRVHTGGEAVQMNREVNAQAFAHGQDVYFGKGKGPGKDSLTAHELTHVIQQSSTPTYQARSIQRKEVKNDSEIQSNRDWTEADRKNNTQRWKDACLVNLKAADSSQYVKVVERRDFYKWFYEYTAALGYTTRWALAAYIVANGAHQIVDMDEKHALANDVLNMANVELQGAMREGNQVIFDNVLPKLKKLFDGGPLKGKSALESDMTMLAEEQSLIQPMYSRMSKDTVDQLDYIARKKRFAGWGAWWTDEDKVPTVKDNNDGRVPGFNQPNIQNIGDRWTYGMTLGNQFTRGGSGFSPGNHSMPTVESSYNNGSEFSKVDTRANLHKLDAWLNPNRLSRIRGNPGSDIEAIIKSLTTFEKQQVLRDSSPDGWSYSLQFAEFSISESIVKQALPSEQASEQAVTGFLSRYKKEVQRLAIKYPQLPLGIGL